MVSIRHVTISVDRRDTEAEVACLRAEQDTAASRYAKVGACEA